MKKTKKDIYKPGIKVVPQAPSPSLETKTIPADQIKMEDVDMDIVKTKMITDIKKQLHKFAGRPLTPRNYKRIQAKAKGVLWNYIDDQDYINTLTSQILTQILKVSYEDLKKKFEEEKNKENVKKESSGDGEKQSPVGPSKG